MLRIILLVSSAVLLLLSPRPGLSASEDPWSGHVTLSGAEVDLGDKSYKYGVYNGVTDDDVYFLGDADIRYNRENDYLEFDAENVGLENKHLSLESGTYGKFKLFLDYNEIIKFHAYPSRTPLDGAGEANLTLPVGFVTGSAGNRTTDLATLLASAKEVNLKQKREIGSFGLSSTHGEVDVGFSFSREYKDGIRSIGGVVGPNGGGAARSIVMPEPVDYVIDKLVTTLGHNGDRAQIQLEYNLFLFENGKESLTWQTPFNVTVVNATTGVTTYQSPINSRTALPPDNQHHRLALSGGMNMFKTTRISGMAEYGIMKQDERILPFSTSTDTSLLPRLTADAEIDTTRLALNMTSRPLSRLGLNAKYKYYQSENKMPKDLFLYVVNDNATGTQVAQTGAGALYSLPYDSLQRQVNLDASYYLIPRTSLLLGYDIDIVNRDYREIEKTREQTYRTRLSSSYFAFAQANMDFSYGVRRGADEYSQSKLYVAEHTGDYIATLSPAVQFDNLPELRKYDVADKKKTRYGINLTTFPHYTTTFALYYNSLRDDYDRSSFGLLDRAQNSFTFDMTVAPSDTASIYSYYTQEDAEIHQAGRNFGGGANKETQSDEPTRDWTARHDDETDTAGIGFRFVLMDDRLTITTDYSFSVSETAVRFWAGSSLTPPEDMPHLKTREHTVSLSGKYKFTENLEIGLGYEYEDYESDDWSTDGVDPASTILPEVITLSGSIPDYTAHLAFVFLTVEF